MVKPDIGIRVRTLREEKCYTRDLLAEKVDISTKFLYEIELAKKGCSADILRRLALALEVSSDYLLTGRKSTIVPEPVMDLLVSFNSDQMDLVCEVLKNVWNICQCEKPSYE